MPTPSSPPGLFRPRRTSCAPPGTSSCPSSDRSACGGSGSGRIRPSTWSTSGGERARADAAISLQRGAPAREPGPLFRRERAHLRPVLSAPWAQLSGRGHRRGRDGSGHGHGDGSRRPRCDGEANYPGSGGPLRSFERGGRAPRCSHDGREPHPGLLGVAGAHAARGKPAAARGRRDRQQYLRIPRPRREVTGMEELIRELLKEIGEDPSREGLERTPTRVAKAWAYLTSGYRQDVHEVLNGALFTEEYDEMVVVKDIDLYSMCEHHLLPFFGKCHIAYMPSKRIIGLSKLPRLVEVFARRLQVQERLTTQIAQTLQDVLQPRGVAVVVEALHMCMLMRGVEKQNSKAVTSAMLGAFRDRPETRAEFMELIKSRSGLVI